MNILKTTHVRQHEKPWRFLITRMHWNVPTSKAECELLKLRRREKETSRFRKSLHFSSQLLIKIAAQRKRTPHCPGTQTSHRENRDTAVYRSRTPKEIRALLLKWSRQQRQKSDHHCLNNRESDYFPHNCYICRSPKFFRLRYSRVSAVPGTRRLWVFAGSVPSRSSVGCDRKRLGLLRVRLTELCIRHNRVKDAL